MVPPAIPLDAQLPDDQEQLKRLVRELTATIQQRDRELAGVRHRLDQLLRRLYGPRSERIRANQPTLFDLGLLATQSQTPAAAQPEAAASTGTKRKRKYTPHGRKPLPDDLPRHREVHEPTEIEKLCPCCQKPRVAIGEEVSEQLDYQPASMFVVENVRPKLACLDCLKKAELAPAEAVEEEVVNSEPTPTGSSADGAVSSQATNESVSATSGQERAAPSDPPALIYTVPMPKQPIPKGLAGPGLLAHIIISKFADHLPLYRQEAMFARQGVEISRSTMSDWVAACAVLCTPLYGLMTRRVLLSRAVHNDDTTVPVQAPRTGKTKTGRLWVSVGDAAHPYIIFNYTPDRSRDGPEKFFENYEGFLQVDAYTGYEGLFVSGKIHEAACWAHVRRKFFESKTTDELRSHLMLAMIRGLYEVEDQVSLLAQEAEKVRYRREHARPLLIRIKKWLKEQQKQVLPKSPLGEAIGYALNNWRALNRYTLYGYLAIDNNVAERALRAVAIGRKNWMFAGSDAGGQTSAVLYSLISSCQRHGIEPWAYLRDVLTRLPELPADRLEELLPDVWAKKQREQIEASEGGS